MARLAVVVGLAGVLGACAGARGPARPSPFPGTIAPRSESPEAAARFAGIVERALLLRGTPYQFGGEDPDTGLDCSGLVRFVFRQAGVELPRTVAEQFDTGRRVDPRALHPGDLIFFDTMEPGPSHVGIAVDAASFVHAPGSGGVVRVDRLSASYWQNRVRGIRRVSLGQAPEPATP